MRKKSLMRGRMAPLAMWLGLAGLALFPSTVGAQVSSPALTSGVHYQPAYPYIPHQANLLAANPAARFVKNSFSMGTLSSTGEYDTGAGPVDVEISGGKLFFSGETFYAGADTLITQDTAIGIDRRTVRSRGTLGAWLGDNVTLGAGAVTSGESGVAGKLESDAVTLGMTANISGLVVGLAQIAEQVRHDYTGVTQKGARTGTLAGLGYLTRLPSDGVLRLSFDSETLPAHDNKLAGGDVSFESFSVDLFAFGHYLFGYVHSKTVANAINGIPTDSVEAAGQTFLIGYGFEGGLNINLKTFRSEGQAITGGLTSNISQRQSSLSLTLVFN